MLFVQAATHAPTLRLSHSVHEYYNSTLTQHPHNTLQPPQHHHKHHRQQHTTCEPIGPADQSVEANSEWGCPMAEDKKIEKDEFEKDPGGL